MLNSTELGLRIERRPLPRLETLLRWMDAIDLNEDMRSLLEESIEELRDLAMGLVSADLDRSVTVVPDGALWQDTATRAPLDVLTGAATGAMFVTEEMIRARNALDAYDEDGDDYIDEGERQLGEDLEPKDGMYDVEFHADAEASDLTARARRYLVGELELRADYADIVGEPDSDDVCDEVQAEGEEEDMNGWAFDDLLGEGARVAYGTEEAEREVTCLESLAELPAPLALEAAVPTDLERDSDDNDVCLPSVDEEAWDEVLDAIGGPQDGFASWPRSEQLPNFDRFEYLDTQEEEALRAEEWRTAPSVLNLLKTLEHCLPTDLDTGDFARMIRANVHHADHN